MKIQNIDDFTAVNEAKKLTAPVIGKKYKDYDGNLWKVEVFEEVDDSEGDGWFDWKTGELYEDIEELLNNYDDDTILLKIDQGDLDSYIGFLCGCTNGVDKQAFLFDGKILDR